MIGVSIKKTTVFVLLLVFSVIAVRAGGRQEAETHHHDDEHHHEDAMALPHIEAVDLDSGESLQVVASTSIVGDVVRQVVGSAAKVDVLMQVGQNPHAYEPTPRDIARVEDSHIVFVNGLNLEEALMETIENVAGSYIVPVSAGIAVLGDEDEQTHEHDHDEEGDHEDHDEDGDEGHHHHTAGDPHFWFDPTNVIIWTGNIAKALSEADPANRATYESNRDAFITELETLDREIRQEVSAIPAARRKLVVDHVALTYFADEYGFKIIGEVIPSVTDQAEPSARHIAELTKVVQDEEVSAIFIGGTAGRGLRNLVRSVAQEAGREIQIVELLTGSLAPRGSRGDSYVDFVEFNTEQIVSALTR